MESHLIFHVAIESRAGQSDDHNHHADVNEVASITARVAANQQKHGRKIVTSALPGDDPCSAQKLRQDGGENARGQRKGHQRVEVALIERAVVPRPHACKQADNHRDPKRRHRQHKIAANALE